MKKLNIELEHCYGIKKLSFSFSFEKCPAVAIYAPNGAMKSSLAKTFQDIAEGVPSKDRIFPARVTTRSVTDETGADLPASSVLVVRPYDEVLGHTEKTSTLLVNATLRKEYEQLHLDIDNAKTALVAALKAQSGSKKDLEKEISSTFTPTDNQFYKALLRVYDEIVAQKGYPFADLKYDVIFDEKVLSFLGTKDFKSVIEGYIKKYNELISASTYFKRGTFNYYNASVIAKTLADNGFFKAKHSLNLNAAAKVEIADEKELEALVSKEKEGISNDADLRKKFAEVEKLLAKNVNVRDFEAYLTENEEILPALANIAAFKEEVWKSYLGTRLDLYSDLVAKYRSAEKRKAEIEEQAGKEQTQWEEVIEIFNARFFVPFKLTPTNKTSVMLGQEPILKLGFTFADGAETADVDRKSLLEVLSTGEKKALYVLNIIFDIRARQKAGEKTLVIVDDIADSFDYRNKYAIIQYLKDISEVKDFYQIILTHNFDFFRTVQSRFVSYPCCFMVAKDANGVVISPAVGIKNIFVKDWKPNFAASARKRIASIPFMRNLVEFTKGEADPAYQTLTSLLHWKPNTAGLLEKDLFDIHNALFGTALVAADGGGLSVVDVIHKEAKECLVAAGGANFENKIVLSIAVRLQAEAFMVQKINDPALIAAMTANQTAILLKEYRSRFPAEHGAIAAIEKVVLMTPENIHLNSFMYEPILDMSDEHLRQIYSDLVSLT